METVELEEFAITGRRTAPPPLHPLLAVLLGALFGVVLQRLLR